MNEKERRALRKSKIRARDSLRPEERRRSSQLIVERILSSEVYQKSKTILIYRATRGEVVLDALEEAENEGGKKLAYPLCISNTDMIALCPHGEDAWVEGHFGIWEPVPEKSEKIAPWDIDLVVCPCTVFDERGGRMGMGAGYYDRYLEKCRYAHVVSVAFETQKADYVPMESWDKPMEMVFTEDAVYMDGKGRK
ncbi:MAG: 5-formyltetrahydrofolate cyclo-ligase [Bacillota bacterium]|nr:5-formyltetrahydrofolate cyclo-ligase [Bacillota bacterium]